MENKANFADSQKDCEDKGANLVSIHDNETNKFLMGMIKPNDALIGLQFDNDNVHNYTWADQSVYDYRRWPSGYNETGLIGYLGKCVMMSAEDGNWVNKKCDEAVIPHICQKPADEPPTDVPPTSDPPQKCPSSAWNWEPGLLSSPGYPYHYDGTATISGTSFLNCSYVLTAPAPIKLTFNELCHYKADDDFLISIYDGMNEKAPGIKNLTDDFISLPKTFTSTGDFIFLRFYSKGKGKWRASWGSSSSSTSQNPSSLTSASGPKGLK